ncbi:hypothetical protein [Pseudomonas nicosulfuronedens]
MRAARRKALAGLAGAAVVILLAWLVMRLFAWGSCSWYGYQTNRDTRYAAFIGCMVRVDQQWIPRNELRVMQ